MAKRTLSATLGMQPEEFRRFRLLFIQSFFTGIFIAFFFTIAVSLFIQKYGNNLLPYAYLGNGIVGLVATNIYLLFQRFAKARTLYIGSMIGLAMILAGFIVIYQMDTAAGFAFEHLAFIMFVMSSTLIVISGLVFSGMIGAMFDLRQAKRLLALISTGEILASTIGYFSISRVLKLLPSPYMLLFVSGIGMVLVLFMMFYIFGKYKENFGNKLIQAKHDDEGGRVKTGNFFSFLGNRHFRMVSLVAILSIMATYFADFGLLGGINDLAMDQAEGDRETYIVGFFAVFFGFAKLAELAMALVAGRLVSQFGMRFGLVLLPLAMAGALVIAILTGALLPGLPFLFFLFLALTRLFDIVIRKSIETPSFKVVYHSLPAKSKAQMAVTIEGMMKQLAIVIAALMLLGATFIFKKGDSVNLLYFSIAILPFVVIWGFMSLRLFKAYREKLKDVLLTGKQDDGSSGSIIALDGFEILETSLKSPVDIDRVNAVRLSGKLSPVFIRDHAVQLLKDKNPDVRKETMKSLICAYGNKEIAQAVKALVDKPFDVEEAELARELHSDLTTDPGSVANMEELLDSKDPKNWKRMIHIMTLRPSEAHNPIVQRMLQSHDSFLRNAGIMMSPNWPQENIKSLILDLFQIPEYTLGVAAILPKFGDEIMESLESLLRKEYSKMIHLRILEIYSRLNSPASRQMLITHLDYQDIEIQMAVVRLFSYTGFKASAGEIPLIKQKIEAFSDNLTWILASLHDLSGSELASEVFKWLDEERKMHREVIMNLLAFIHDRSSLNVVLENLQEDKTAAENAFAMELLDNLVDDDIKRWILPLFENAPMQLKVKKLHNTFPQEELAVPDRLRDIINRNYVVTNNWLKALAIEAWLQLEDEAPEDIYSALFHSSPLLYEVSLAVLLKSIRGKKLNDLVSRITPREKSEELKSMMAGKYSRLYKIDAAKALENQVIYDGEYSSHLATISGVMDADKIAKGEMLEFEEDTTNALLILEGELVGYGENKFGDDGYTLLPGEWSLAHVNTDPSIRSWYAKEDTVVMHADLHHLILTLMNNNPIFRRFLMNVKPMPDVKPQITLGS